MARGTSRLVKYGSKPARAGLSITVARAARPPKPIVRTCADGAGRPGRYSPCLYVASIGPAKKNQKTKRSDYNCRLVSMHGRAILFFLVFLNFLPVGLPIGIPWYSAKVATVLKRFKPPSFTCRRSTPCTPALKQAPDTAPFGSTWPPCRKRTQTRTISTLARAGFGRVCISLPKVFLF